MLQKLNNQCIGCWFNKYTAQNHTSQYYSNFTTTPTCSDRYLGMSLPLVFTCNNTHFDMSIDLVVQLYIIWILCSSDIYWVFIITIDIWNIFTDRKKPMGFFFLLDCYGIRYILFLYHSRTRLAYIKLEKWIYVVEACAVMQTSPYGVGLYNAHWIMYTSSR